MSWVFLGLLNDVPAQKLNCQVAAAEQMNMGWEAQGLNDMRLHPEEISLWTSKACNRN